jgi:hypothetical protein
VLDENHSDTLASVANSALDLRALGEHEQARVLTDNTMAHRRRMLGEGPPTTRITGYNHAVNLHAADEHKHTSEKTVSQRGRVPGEDHSDALASTNDLAVDRSALDEHHRLQ